jgi:hypothetical protein
LFSWEIGLEIIDAINFVPSRNQEVGSFASRFGLFDPMIITVADDVLILVAEVLRSYSLQVSREKDAAIARRAAAGSAPFDKILIGLRERSAALTSFTTAIRSYLSRPDTPGRIAALDVQLP